MPKEASSVLYFAYGSNMDTATLGRRRGIAYSRAAACRADGWRLAIDKPSLLGTGEAVATIVTDPASEVWGVLYEIAGPDMEHLAMTEGELLGHYTRIELGVSPLRGWPESAGTPLRALTFASETRVTSLRPSVRYMNLLLSGAVEHGLPLHWQDMLRAIPAAEETAESLAMRPFLEAALRKPA